MGTENLFYPSIKIQRADGGFIATIGMSLSSILSARVYDIGIWDVSVNRVGIEMDPHRFHRAYSALLKSLSAWDRDTILELHYTSYPDLAHIVRGSINTTLLLHTISNTEEGAREKVLNRYTILHGLLNAYILEAEFSPVQDPETLESRHNPFKPNHAISIKRRRELLSLATTSDESGSEDISSIGGQKGRMDAKEFPVDYVFPWKTSGDDMRRLAEAFLWYPSPLWLVVRIRPARDLAGELRCLEYILHLCEAFLSTEKQIRTRSKHRAHILRDATFKRIEMLKEGGFNMDVFLFSQYRIDEGIVRTVGQTITSGVEDKELRMASDLLEGGFSYEDVSPALATSPTFIPTEVPFTPSEAACAFRLPWPPAKSLPGFSVKSSRTSFADLPDDFLNSPDAVSIGSNMHRGIIQPVPLLTDNRMQHMFIIGMTGTGKSTILEHMVLQDIRSGRGLCLIDPHGELVEGILGKFPKERADDLILIDILDKERPIPMNFLNWRTVEERDFIIDELFATLMTIYRDHQMFGPVFEQNFRGMMKLLLGDSAREAFVPTLLEFHMLYLNPLFRKLCLMEIKDDQIRDFVLELEQSRMDYSIQNCSPYITSKISRFIHDTTLKRIVGYGGMCINFEEVMDTGKVVLCNLGKGQFGETVSSLFAGMIVSRFKAATMKRASVPANERRDFFLYVDEFQNIANESFSELLAEARKYRLGLIMANQYAEQLEGNRTAVGGKGSVLSAILGNVGTILSFRLGVRDAESLSPVFSPAFSKHDLMELPDRECYVRMHNKKHNIQPFSMHTVKDTTPYDNELAQTLREYSRLKYGVDAGDIDSAIMRRRQQIEHLCKGLK